jgi:hypothetical protein
VLGFDRSTVPCESLRAHDADLREAMTKVAVGWRFVSNCRFPAQIVLTNFN